MNGNSWDVSLADASTASEKGASAWKLSHKSEGLDTTSAIAQRCNAGLLCCGTILAFFKNFALPFSKKEVGQKGERARLARGTEA